MTNELSCEPAATEDFWEGVRHDFPILGQHINGRPLIYLDNAATTQIPMPVLEAIVQHYATSNGNVHRATHTLSARSTCALEQARQRVATFLGAAGSNEVVFTRGTTDSLNMLASSYACKEGSAFSAVVTALEHHSNFVPWQQAAARTGGAFSVAPLTSKGDVDLEAFERILKTQRPGVAAFAHVSNVLGTVNPLKEMISLAHCYGWLTVVDAAQGVRHEALDVAALECDFLCFSGHKIMGPTGIGVLYGKEALLNNLPPVAFGGEMVDRVQTPETTFERAPLRFEAGTPNYVGALGLAAALDYLEGLGWNRIRQREAALLALLEEKIAALDGLALVGEPARRAGVLSYVLEGAHPFDVATLLDKLGVAVRSGNQCAQPLLHEWCDCGMVLRFSPAFYNTPDEMGQVVFSLERALRLCRQ